LGLYRHNHGVSGFVDHYRSRFPAPSVIAGFGEVAADSELSELLPFLDHPTSRARYEAIRALGNREMRTYAPEIRRCLSADKAYVVREAIKALVKLGYRIPKDELEALLHNAEIPKVGKALERGLDLLPRWQSIELALTLCAKNRLVRNVDRFLDQWLAQSHRDYFGPSWEQLADAQSAF
jgi:hypothetical protein